MNNLTMQVTLSDGSTADISSLDRQALAQLQFQQEQDFAQRIIRAPKGSPERQKTIEHGYETICSILARMYSGERSLVMGFDRRYVQLVVSLLRRSASPGHRTPTLFEIGYGSGGLLSAVAAAGFPVAGIEVCRTMRDQAVNNVPAEFHDRLFLGDLLKHDLDRIRGTFDVVYWNDVLEHIPPDEVHEVLARIRELLRPDGCLVTITPNWHYRPSDVTVVFRPPRSEAIGLHLKEYTLREVTALVRLAGFHRVETPLVILPNRIVLGLGGLTDIKRLAEPALEYLPFPLARRLCHGFGLSCTIAYHSNPEHRHA